MAAMTHQEVFQQQIIINHLIRGRLRWERGARVHCNWQMVSSRSGTFLNCVGTIDGKHIAILRRPRTRQFGIYDQLKVEFRKEDPRTFQKSSAIQIKYMMKY